MTKISENKYFHCYATANDSRYYYRDIQNLLRIKNTYSGVNKVVMYVAISEVNKKNYLDSVFVWAVKKLFNKDASIELRNVIIKNNRGRDFSSYAIMNSLIQKEASPDDYVFFQNRSGYGPFRKGWLKEIILQYEKYDNTAICGSTINFSDHPKRSQRKNLQHVQTYAFLMKVSFLEQLRGEFPGEKENLRLNIILNGEIGLSQFFLERGYGITCMEWPDKYIINSSKTISNGDVKENVIQQHQFYHKVYFNKLENNKISIIRYWNAIFLFLISCIFIRKISNCNKN